MDKPTSPVRSCIECGKVFTGSKRRCNKCQRKERTCDKCGKAFTGKGRICSRCGCIRRICEGCGKEFTGGVRRCQACRATDRTCIDCGERFLGTTRCCGRCRRTERICTECGRSFKGHERRCSACAAKERMCAGCGRGLKSIGRFCAPCRNAERQCEACGKTFTGDARRCVPCRRRARPPEIRRARDASQNASRRARKRGAQVSGPVPPETYASIQGSGPCVYCGGAAETVDHVRPLARGGWEHESNLEPACKSCNSSKGHRLLTEWARADRVAYGIEHSSKVAAEYKRLVSEAA